MPANYLDHRSRHRGNRLGGLHPQAAAVHLQEKPSTWQGEGGHTADKHEIAGPRSVGLHQFIRTHQARLGRLAADGIERSDIVH
jgi:hypothetical protein